MISSLEATRPPHASCRSVLFEEDYGMDRRAVNRGNAAFERQPSR